MTIKSSAKALLAADHELPAPRLGYSVAEAAEAAGISRSSIYLAIGRGDLRAIKLGKRTLIRHADLVAFLDRLPAMGAEGVA